MSTTEFLNAFELKYNMILSNAAPALDPYEISYFLSTAQKDLVIEVYLGNFSGSAFEGSEDVRQYINHLIKVYTTSDEVTGIGVNSKSKFYTIPDDVWFRVYEWVDYNDDSIDCAAFVKEVTVIPITHDEYHIIKNNPFRKQGKRRVLRLDYSNSIAELISDYNIGTYGMRYLVMPTPIIIDDLDYGLSIDGVSTKSECLLNTVFHETILNRAVDLAKFAWQGAANSKV